MYPSFVGVSFKFNVLSFDIFISLICDPPSVLNVMLYFFSHPNKINNIIITKINIVDVIICFLFIIPLIILIITCVVNK